MPEPILYFTCTANIRGACCECRYAIQGKNKDGFNMICAKRNIILAPETYEYLNECTEFFGAFPLDKKQAKQYGYIYKKDHYEKANLLRLFWINLIKFLNS